LDVRLSPSVAHWANNNKDYLLVSVIERDAVTLPTALCQREIAAFFIWQPFGARSRFFRIGRITTATR
jgi:hypothetical protein